MMGIIRRYNWEQFPITIPVQTHLGVQNVELRMEKVILKRSSGLCGVLKEIHEAEGENLDER
jgi:hypothetical protein